MRGAIDIHMDAATSRVRSRKLRLCVRNAAGQLLSAAARRAAADGRRAVRIDGAGRRDRGACRSSSSMAKFRRSACASAASPIRPISTRIPRRKPAASSKGSTSGSSTRCATRRIPSHLSLDEALAWIERMRPRRADHHQSAHRPRLRGAQSAPAAPCRAGL